MSSGLHSWIQKTIMLESQNVQQFNCSNANNFIPISIPLTNLAQLIIELLLTNNSQLQFKKKTQEKTYTPF